MEYAKLLELKIRWYTVVFILDVYKLADPRKLKNQVVNLHYFATGHESGSARAANARRCICLLQVTASLMALAGERAVLYESTIQGRRLRANGRSVGRHESLSL